jgi:type II secretory pathway predicted ATPase ExeA
MPAASATEAAEPAAPASAAPAAAAPAAPPLAEGTPEPPFDLAALAQRAASCEMFFGFDDPPFRLAPDPDYLFHSPAYTRALSVLVEWLRTGPPIGLLFGEPGCGKSLLVASLARRFDYRRPVPVVIRPTRGESARDVLIEAALGRAAALHGQLPREGADPLERWREVVAELRRRNVLTIFLVDDAHRLPEANLRAFAELVDGEAARVAVRALLVGCEPLRRVVAAPPLSPHLGAACALGPLDSDEVGSYIAHRILIASGKSDPFFTQRAIELIADYSRGVPRLINVAASAALFCAFRAGRRVVTHEAVGEALRDALGVGTAPGAAPA